MFQRIARRHADRSDESVPADHVPEPPADAPAPAPPPGEATVEVPAVDAPTERIEAVAPAPSVGQPTVFGPPPGSAAQPATAGSSVPPPAMDLTSRLPVTPAPASPEPVPAVPQPASTAEQTVVAEPARRPGFRARGRLRRRLRYLRKLRELQVRDLGGLVFDLRRFERKRDDLVAQKIDQIRACDDELRALEQALDERRELRDVREPGIGGTCPRCFAIYGSADKFCANCGAALGGAVQSPAHAPLAPPASAPEASGPAPRP